jgi:hypothetical protein
MDDESGAKNSRVGQYAIAVVIEEPEGMRFPKGGTPE